MHDTLLEKTFYVNMIWNTKYGEGVRYCTYTTSPEANLVGKQRY